jgi:small conductance mechanosensitive channel
VRVISHRVKELDGDEDSLLDRRTDTISRVISTAGVTILAATSLAMILEEVGIAIGPLIASVGVAGLALGLGAQTLVKDVISGLFILTENQYTMGDVIKVNGIAGSVEQMTLRVTYIRDLEGVLHSVPNGEIRTVSNITRGWSRAVLNVQVPIETDLDHVLDTLGKAGERLHEDPSINHMLLEEPQVTGVEGIDGGQASVRIMVKTAPDQHWAVLRRLRQLVVAEFKARGIEFSLPRQDVRLTRTNGDAPY